VQAARTLLETPEFEFEGHGTHAIAPTTIEYIPTSQSAHTAFPAVSVYLPATQFAHRPPFCPDEPALQVHASRALAPEANEFEFVGHGPHTLAPATSEYVPTPQFPHIAVPTIPLNLPTKHGAH
jgi:hypothetical protein